MRTVAPNLLDEIAVASDEIVARASVDIAKQIGSSIGAILEYEFARRYCRPSLPLLSSYGNVPVISLVEHACDRAKADRGSLSLRPIAADATAIPCELRKCNHWSAFVKRAETSACEVGFGVDTAAGVAGAIGELADNIMEHSESPDSGVAAFAAHDDCFEYSIADAGIGMLASFQRCLEFRSLRDDLEALDLAVTAGVSRRGRGSGYGYGYRAVFLPLKAARGSVRLRSGKAVLEVEGDGPTPDRSRCSHRPLHRGVTVTVKIYRP